MAVAWKEKQLKATLIIHLFKIIALPARRVRMDIQTEATSTQQLKPLHLKATTTTTLIITIGTSSILKANLLLKEKMAVIRSQKFRVLRSIKE